MAKKSADDGTKKSTKGSSSAKAGDQAAKHEVKALAKDVERLRATVEKLETKLEKAEKKLGRWKAEAKSERTRSAKLEAKLRRARAERPSDHDADSGDVPVDPPREEEMAAVAPVSPAVTAVEEPTDAPDASWTVVRLRTAAREAGVVGASRKTKAQLLESLAR